jgi:hypothetical protein
MERIEELLAVYQLNLMNAIVEKDIPNKEIFLAFEIKLSTRDVAHKLLEKIVTIPGVRKVRLE